MKNCENCFKILPDSYIGNICPNCLDEKLFYKVKDYIRKNDVSEYQVAEHFNIPISKVKKWIKDGRIGYKVTEGINTTKCICCGQGVLFGNLCFDCTRQKREELKRKSSGYVGQNLGFENNKMRFI